MGQFTEPVGSILKTSLAIVGDQCGGVCRSKTPHEFGGDTGTQTFMAFDNQVHIGQGRCRSGVQQAVLGTLDIAQHEGSLVAIGREIVSLEERAHLHTIRNAILRGQGCADLLRFRVQVEGDDPR